VEQPLAWRNLSIPNRVTVETNNQNMAVSGPVVALPSSQPGFLTVSRDNGARWTRISIAEIGQLAKKTAFPAPTGNNPLPSLASVLLNDSFPSSYFVTVSAIAKKYGSAPPIFYTPYVSTNQGRTWSAVPTPRGSSPGEFEGFENDGARVYALYAHGVQTVSEFSVDGGRHWQIGSMACPAAGPCVTFGPFADNYPGMGAPDPQTIWRRGPHSQWVPSTTITSALVGRPSYLVPLTHSSMLRLDGLSPYPLEVTENGGRSWQYVALPPLPGGSTGFLMMLSNGDLLGDGLNHWYLLKPGSSVWVEAPAVPQGGVGPMYTSPGYLWWVGGASNSRSNNVGGDVHQLADSAL
jgi:hypothetical protein